MLSTKAKIVAICITMAVTVVSFVCSTLAYFTDSATASGGMIAAGRAEVEIVDITYPYGSDVSVGADDPIDIMPGYEISKKLVVRNIGDLPLYIRVRIQSEITLADAARGREAEIDPSLVGYDINTEHWEYRDGYYYYRSVLGHGNESISPFTKVSFSERMGNLYKDSTIRFNLRVEVVQANNNGTNVFDAVGWSDASTYEGGIIDA